jgi:(p)ppGpp synthase/HD superfamily hydrolase
VDNKGIAFFTIEVEDYAQLEDIIRSIKKVRNVLAVERLQDA